MRYAVCIIVLFALVAVANAAVQPYTTKADCEANDYFWCRNCQGIEGNTFGHDTCVSNNGECNYGCSLACGSKCTSNGQCKNNLTDTTCKYAGMCSSCGCNYIEAECPQNGTVSDGICHYGKRECSSSGCAIGRCELKDNQICDPENGCVYGVGVANAEYYEDYRCDGDNVFAKKVFYSCTGGTCVYSKYDALVQRCENGCSDGKCNDALCNLNGLQFDCNRFDGFYDSKYCVNDDVFKSYRDYFCGDTECKFAQYEIKQESCVQCSGGVCTTPQRTNITDYTKTEPPQSNTTQAAQQPATQGNSYVLDKGGRAYSGWLFGSGDVTINVAGGRNGVLFFNVTRTNRLGDLNITTNGRTLFSGSPKPGSYRIDFTDSGSAINFATTSSGWFIISPSLYEIKYITVYYG